MIRKILTAALPLLVLLAIPFFLRPKQEAGAKSSGPADKLVIISAHTESSRHEYEQAVRKF